jgi:hypothetical protein
MRKRIYWLLPDHASARQTMNDLLLARIDEGHIHFAASDGAETEGLHMASILQTSDLVVAAQNGALMGAGLGAAAGALAAFTLVSPGPMQAGVVVLVAGVGAVFGTWGSSMIGSSTPSRRLKRFEKAMERGEYLLMVDVPRGRIQEIEKMLEARHPEGHFEGVEPNIPAFP